jgi:hypothetical protein
MRAYKGREGMPVTTQIKGRDGLARKTWRLYHKTRAQAYATRAKAMSDELYKRILQNPVRKPRPNELVFTFVRASARAAVECTLRFHGEWGVEAMFLRDGELVIARRVDTRAQALNGRNLNARRSRKASSDHDAGAIRPSGLSS